MDKDRIDGALHQVKGAIKDGVGKATDDTQTQAEGAVERDAGRVESAVGKAKDTVRDAVNKP